MYTMVIYWKANIVKLFSLHKLFYRVNADTFWQKLTSLCENLYGSKRSTNSKDNFDEMLI